MTESASTPKRPWRTPELRDLGSVAELTQTNFQSIGGTDTTVYAT